MKTLNQIQQKANSLQAKLQRKPICENFGESEQQKLSKYIDNIYDYDYNTRQRVNSITYWFFNWCINYTGESK